MAHETKLEKDKMEAESISETKEKTKPETEEKKDEEVSDNSKSNDEEEGFWKKSWKSIKTGAQKGKKKLIKAISKEPDDMSDEEFDQYLQDEEADGNEGFSARYYALVEELKKMPSLMQLAKEAEPEDIKEAAQPDSAAKSEKKEVKPEATEEKTEAKQESKTAEAGVKDIKKESKATEAGAKDIKKESKATEAGTKEIKKAKKKDKTAEADTKETEKESRTVEAGTKEAKKAKEEGNTTDTETKENKKEVKAAKAEVEEKIESEEAKPEVQQEAKSEETKPESEEEKAESTIDKLMDMKDDGIKIGTDAVSIYKSSKRRKALEALAEKTDPNSPQGRQIAYMKEQAKKESVTGGFSIAKNVVNTVNKALEKFGSKKISGIAAKISKYANMALEFGQNFAVNKIEKKAKKNGLKGLLGGSEVYKKLKDKYKLSGGAMRRAIRVAANRSSVQDLVDADKDKLSEEYEHNVEGKEETTASYMGLAGGRNATAARKTMGRSVADTKEKKEEQEGN